MKPNSRSMFTFDAVVDWHQRHEFLKCKMSVVYCPHCATSWAVFLLVELPLNIHNDNATYETQFGHVQRPTHRNTTWDIAKFEVCGHKVFCFLLNAFRYITYMVSALVCWLERVWLRSCYPVRIQVWICVPGKCAKNLVTTCCNSSWCRTRPRWFTKPSSLTVGISTNLTLRRA